MPQPETELDYDYLLRSNLERVFNERDAARRAAAFGSMRRAGRACRGPDGGRMPVVCR